MSVSATTPAQHDLRQDKGDGDISEKLYQVKSLPTLGPPTLSLPVDVIIKQDIRFEYYPRTAKLCIHVKSSYPYIPASLCAILSENLFFYE